jgi:hypothetical protein
LENTEPDFGAAVRVTAVPLLNLALQVVLQLIPEGLLVAVPAPVPALFKVRVNVVAEAERADAQRQSMPKSKRQCRLEPLERRHKTALTFLFINIIRRVPSLLDAI